MRRLQSNFKNDDLRNLMHTKHSRDNPKLRIFSFIPQRERIQPNLLNHTYKSTKQRNTTRTTKTTTSTRVLYSNFAISLPVSYISSITKLYTLSIPKNLFVAWWTISYILSIPTWIRYQSITERLTAFRIHKLKNARDKHGFFSIWTVDGKIMVKNNGNGKLNVYHG